VDGDGETRDIGYYEIDEDMVLRSEPDDTDAAEYLRENAAIEPGGMDQAPGGDLHIEMDAASVIVFEGTNGSVYPKGTNATAPRGPVATRGACAKW